MTFLKGHWQLFLLTALVFALWNTSVILPLKILVVFLHELAHGLAAVLTGGSIEEISLNPQQGGHAITRGGNLFLILTAGYIGSLLLGVILFLIALRTHADKAVMALLGAVILLITALYIRDSFAILFCAATGLVMLAIARFLSREINDLLLRVIGLTSIMYAPYDIFSDTIARSELRSDAFMLAERFGGSAMVWGVVWLIISLAVIAFCARFVLGQSSNITFGRIRS